MTTSTFSVTARQVRQWRDAYYATFSTANKADFDRAKLLAEIRDAVTSSNIAEFLRSVNGLSLTKREADNALELLTAYDRYPNSDLLWDALGKRIVRIVRITDANVRRRVRRKVERLSQYVDGYVSDSRLSGIIMDCDPDYYDNNPGERALWRQRMDTQIESIDEQREAVESERATLLRGMRAAIAALEEQDIDGRSFFTRAALRVLDRDA